MYFDIEDISFFLPKKTITNEQLEKINPAWNFSEIEKKTGIHKRHYSDNITTKEMAINAIEKLPQSSLSEINFMIYVSQTTHPSLPSTSNYIQNKMNLNKNIFTFDMGLGCSGFPHALLICASMMKNSKFQKCLLVFSEAYTKHIDLSDRNTATIFSDAASALIISNKENHMLIDSDFGSDGSGSNYLAMKSNKIFMDGSAVFMFTMREIPNSINKILSNNGMKINSINHFIFHQASKLVIDNLTRILKIDKEKVHINYENIGNTVSSSIPILLQKLISNVSLKKNDYILISGFGVGLSWGTILIKW